MKKILIIFLAAACTGLSAAAQAPIPLLEGHGDTTWRSSLEEVSAVVPDLKPGRLAGTFTEYVTTHGKAERTTYYFYADHLYLVEVTYRLPDAPESGSDKVGASIIQSMITKKYTTDSEVADALRIARISIIVSPRPDGTIIVAYEKAGIMDEVREQLRQAREEAAGTRIEAVNASGIEDDL